MAPRVLLYSLNDKAPLAERHLAERGLAGALEVVCRPHTAGTTPTREELEGFDAVVGEYMPVAGPAVEAFGDAGVRLLASMSIGVNHMDVAGLAERGVTVSNCPGYCSQEVATHAVALMLDLNRSITRTNRGVLAGGWDPLSGAPMRRIAGQTLGLVFFGNIARAVTPMAQGLGMNVMAWAPTKSAEELATAGVTKAETLEELLGASDVVSLHCPLIPETRNLMDAKAFAAMKRGAHLINTARGDVVDEGALLDALDSGQVGGAGLDVVRDEFGQRNRRLLEHPRVVVTPHSAFDSMEAQQALVDMTLDACIELLLEGRTPTHVVPV